MDGWMDGWMAKTLSSFFSALLYNKQERRPLLSVTLSSPAATTPPALKEKKGPKAHDRGSIFFQTDMQTTATPLLLLCSC